MPQMPRTSTWHLPQPDVETQPYWAIENQPGAAEPLVLTSAAEQTGADMDPLVALFREQIALLQAQAKVVQQQAETLAGRGVAVPVVTIFLGMSFIASSSVGCDFRPDLGRMEDGVEEDRFEVYGRRGKLTLDRYLSRDVQLTDADLKHARLKRLGSRNWRLSCRLRLTAVTTAICWPLATSWA